MKKLREALAVAIPHYQEICWLMKIVEKADFHLLSQDTILIYTDFAATMVLGASEKKNSSLDGHAVLANFVVISNRRFVPVEESIIDSGVKLTSEEEVRVFDVDVHHFFAETISPGKKNDYQMHNACLDEIVKVYKTKIKTLKEVIYRTDNAPSQYRCRQNFIQTASFCERHPDVKVTHDLAVPDNFKGNHDAVGKVVKHFIRNQELENKRCPDAFSVFQRCKADLDFSESPWKEHEATRCSTLKQKGVYGMDSRTSWFVCEDEPTFKRLKDDKNYQSFKQYIILCDRSSHMDTKTIKGTHSLHEVKSVATEIPTDLPKKWPLQTAHLPCRCKECEGDHKKECLFSSWLEPKEECVLCRSK